MCIALISAVLIFFTGVLPANQDSQTFVQQQREQQFKDLKQGLTTLRRVQDTDSPELTVLKLYLLEQGQLPFEDSELVQSKKCTIDSFMNSLVSTFFFYYSVCLMVVFLLVTYMVQFLFCKRSNLLFS